MICLGLLRSRERKRDFNGVLPKDAWPDHVVTLDAKSFDEFIKQYPLSVVDFWAPWCAPCRAVSPRIRRLSKMYKGKVAFGKLNTQNHEEIAKKNHIRGIPHLAFYQYGKKILSITGVQSLGVLKDTLDTLLNRLKE